MKLAPYPIPAEAETPCMANPDLFFPDKHAPARAAKAKKECAPCPFIDGCRDWAVTRGEEGVWGATDDAERVAIRKARGIVPVRPTLDLPRSVRNNVAHGTAVGVEVHRKRYMPLCGECASFVEGRYVAADRRPCGACGTLLLPASLSKHRRLSCPARERVAS